MDSHCADGEHDRSGGGTDIEFELGETEGSRTETKKSPPSTKAVSTTIIPAKRDRPVR